MAFIDRLDLLLAERKELRQLLQARKRDAQRGNPNAEVASICELVLKPLNLHKRDIPNVFNLVDAVQTVMSALPFAFDDPTAALRGRSLVPGIVTEWHPSITKRLIELVAPLDSTLLEMRQEKAA